MKNNNSRGLPESAIRAIKVMVAGYIRNMRDVRNARTDVNTKYSYRHGLCDGYAAAYKLRAKIVARSSF